MLDVALLFLYTIVLPIYVERQELRRDLTKHINLALFGWLAAVMGISTWPVGYPWALQHAKEASPQVAWHSLTFRSIVDQVAVAWAVAMAIICLLCVVPVALDQAFEMEPMNIVFNYVVPYVILATMLLSTRFWPSIIRNRYYLPKVHGGTVKPDAAGQAGQPGDVQADGTTAQQQQVPGQQAAAALLNADGTRLPPGSRLPLGTGVPSSPSVASLGQSLAQLPPPPSPLGGAGTVMQLGASFAGQPAGVFSSAPSPAPSVAQSQAFGPNMQTPVRSSFAVPR